MNTNTDENRFSLTRFANVAHSAGSVLPFWLKLKKEGNPLKLTAPNMNRLIFTKEDAASLINRTIDFTKEMPLQDAKNLWIFLLFIYFYIQIF